MRIGIDARLRAYRSGGIAEHVTRLIEGLAALDAPERIVVCEHRRAGHAPSGPPFEVRRLWTPPHHVLEGWTLPVELAPARLDLWHAPDVVVPRAWRGGSVATVHDVAFLRHPELLAADSLRYYRNVHRSVRQADRIIVVSDYTRRELVALTAVDAGKVRVVPNAVHPRYAAPGDPSGDAAVVRTRGLTEPYILFVSTIEPRKNIVTLLSAYRALLADGRAVTLALAGADGWHSAPVYAAVRDLGVEGRAHFLGHVPGADLAALYRCAAVLAHPALDEGFGLTPLEAMAAGTPVVVSDAGSLPEVVGDAALRVPPDDPVAWATALRRVLDNSSLARTLAAAGRRRAAEFTIDRMASATLAVYREVLAERSGRVR
jgi:glycosyltransferase involved in cell wall biosynthesis